jgi:hypothetical protein
MTRLRRWLPVAMLAVWALVGLGRAAYQVATAARAPAWERHLAPLREAPIAAGAAVALLTVVPAGAAVESVRPVLMEAAWQRPDLRWALLPEWPPGDAPTVLVGVDGAAVPPGWRQTWRQGAIAVYARGRP